MKLRDKVAIITGGSRGIGKGISQKFAAEGASVVIVSTNPAPAFALAEEINSAGGQAAAIQADVRDFESVKRMVAGAIEAFGRVDILVNNAGGSAREKMSLFCDSEQSTWNQVLGVNMMGVFYTCRAVINHMLDRGSGAIVNIASVAGMIGFASQVDYSASKGAVIAFSQALAKETTPKGVRVNCISPGPIKSDAAKQFPPEALAKLAKSELGRATGFGHFGDPADIANLAALLASDEGQYISGQNYAVCGLMNLGLISPLGG